MPTLQFTTKQLQQFFSGTYFHKTYNETVCLTSELKVHADGIYPQLLIEQRRPSESLSVKDYRKTIWKPITKPIIGKVITSLNKIRRSSDWSIQFTNEVPKSIAEGEALSDYCDKKFPYFDSVTNWAFNVLLRAYVVDPNALICIYPIREELPPNTYIRPFPNIFYSEQVIEYVKDDYAVVKSTDKVQYDANNATAWGDVYYIITTQSVQRYEQILGDRSMKLAWEYVHGLGELPVEKTKGIFKRACDTDFIFESRLSVMIPRLDEALREYSDLQAEVVQHIFSEKWEFVTDECKTCKGRGYVQSTGFAGGEIVCTSCSGTGNKPRGPYTNLQIKPPMAGEATLPTPPIGYVQKDVSIVDIQDKRIDKHLYCALSAINMQFLEDTPLSESGVAKEVDRDELNNFVNSIAEDLVAILDKVVHFINEMRYSIVIADKQKRMGMLPTINVPEKFDILSTTYLETELQNVKANNLNPVIINALEVEYANKKFSADPSVRERVSLMLSLDPLAGISEDDKMTRLSNKGINMESYVISCNLQEFIQRAENENQDFLQLPTVKQQEIIKQYATELTDSQSANNSIIQELQPSENNNSFNKSGQAPTQTN